MSAELKRYAGKPPAAQRVFVAMDDRWRESNAAKAELRLLAEELGLDPENIDTGDVLAALLRKHLEEK